MKRNLVALAIMNSTGLSLTVAGLEILPFDKKPDGQDFTLPLSTAKQVEKEIDALNYPIKCTITPIEEKTAEKLAFDIASIELGQAQVIADDLKEQAIALNEKGIAAMEFAESKQVAFDEAKAVLEKSLEKEPTQENLEANKNAETEQSDSKTSEPKVKVASPAKAKTASTKKAK